MVDWRFKNDFWFRVRESSSELNSEFKFPFFVDSSPDKDYPIPNIRVCSPWREVNTIEMVISSCVLTIHLRASVRERNTDKKLQFHF